MGFFAESVLIDTPIASSIPKCGLCKLYKECTTPKMKVFGKGRRGILIVGEAPSRNEDEKGRPFISKSGTFLKGHLKRIGVDRDKDCWLYNALICRPPGNATPTDEQIEYCNPNLQNIIRELQPKVIITLGLAATRAVTLGIWKDKMEAFGRWVGWAIPDRTHNAWVCPTYHPSYVQRELEQAKMGTPIERMFHKHLKQAVRKSASAPYSGGATSLESLIEVIIDENRIVKLLEKFAKRGGPAATDLEANMLKPDAPNSRIVSASVCWRGRRTIAFPFHSRRVRVAYRKVLKRCFIIAHGSKFEQRWIWREGDPNRIYEGGPTMPIDIIGFDTMNGAHLWDNRQKLCGLKFQAYVNFGVPTYNEAIDQFLHQKHSYKENKINEIELHDLLLYNGMDSLLCYMLAVKQSKHFGIPLK